MTLLTLPLTGEDTVGPYYPVAFCDNERSDLTRLHSGVVYRSSEPHIVLCGQVLDMNGDRIAPVLVEFSFANEDGRRLSPTTLGDPAFDPWFTGHTRQYCEDGWYSLRFTRPGPIKASEDEGARAPHVTMTLFCDGVARLVTQLYLQGEPANEHDPLLSSLPTELAARLIAERRGEEDGATIYQCDLRLRGALETPFFDDLAT